jgi:hypothetical protein
MKTTWRHPGYDALNEKSKPVVVKTYSRPGVSPDPQVSVGCTMRNFTTLELLDDGTLQVRDRDLDKAVNLGRAKEAMEAMAYSMNMLKIHF